MSWQDDLRRVVMADGRVLIGASFRGVPFFVDKSERSGGRRLVNHEFIGRDDNFVEDLGRKSRAFSVEGYVIGDDYVAQRDKLLDALEAEGPGELVHPYHGVMRVACDSQTVGESREEGRLARFAITFVETPLQPPAPSAVDDLADKVSAAVDAANDATDAEFVDQYDATALASFAFASAEDALTKASAALQDKLARVVSATQELAQVNSDLTILTAEASSLVRQPAVIVGQFRDVFTGLVLTAAAAPSDLMTTLLDTYDVPLGDPVVATTATRARELANQVALQNALRRALVCEAARLAPLVTFASIEETIAARDRIADALEEQAAAADDIAYPALVDLRSQVLLAVPGGQAFASVVTVTRSLPIPSLLLTYQLYGSVDGEQDVIDRNDISHPGFVAGDLKVLSDG